MLKLQFYIAVRIANFQRNIISQAIWIGEKMNKRNLKGNGRKKPGRPTVNENMLNGKGEIKVQRKIVLRRCLFF